MLANPPYYSDYRIAESFIRAAHRALGRGGELWLVAKAAAEHADAVRDVFGGVALRRVDGYGIINARRR